MHAQDGKQLTLDEFLHAWCPATEERRRMAMEILRGNADARREEDPRLLCVKDAAELIGVSRWTLYRAVKFGALRQIELWPGTFRFRRSDILDLAAGRAAR